MKVFVVPMRVLLLHRHTVTATTCLFGSRGSQSAHRSLRGFLRVFSTRASSEFFKNRKMSLVEAEKQKDGFGAVE